MSLSKSERLILWNQCRILELLDKNESSYYARMTEAISSGYEDEYAEMLDRFSDPLPHEECRFVQRVLAMHEALQRSRDALSDPSKIPESWVIYKGFDGNQETSYMGYSRFLVEQKGLWNYIKIADHNSHMPSSGTYETMLDRWEGLGSSYDLTLEQITEILGR